MNVHKRRVCSFFCKTFMNWAVQGIVTSLQEHLGFDRIMEYFSEPRKKNAEEHIRRALRSILALECLIAAIRQKVLSQ